MNNSFEDQIARMVLGFFFIIVPALLMKFFPNFILFFMLCIFIIFSSWIAGYLVQLFYKYVEHMWSKKKKYD